MGKALNSQIVLSSSKRTDYKISKKLDIYKCRYLYYSNITFDKWIPKKYLHDYFKNYDTINHSITSEIQNCKMYCEYVNYISTLNEKYIKGCHPYFYKTDHFQYEYCPHFFKCDKEKNPYDLLHKLNCKVQKTVTT
ncbi:hypothetical protein PVBG_05338 [Plasmodium vivax Brazil I]|uniref:PIR Superfamily Protein n=1 Tax=Plasmodium vivax (strain Brazil I) TaxID=1033975 RepID=A0A0J9SUF1_PLAV1|nr:hypothetical protein PVBG_05338 [Plasmodium vivax Brazil I]